MIQDITRGNKRAAAEEVETTTQDRTGGTTKRADAKVMERVARQATDRATITAATPVMQEEAMLVETKNKKEATSVNGVHTGVEGYSSTPLIPKTESNIIATTMTTTK